MPRPSNTQITAQHAKKIVKKLKAKPSSSGHSKAHKFYDVFHEDQLVLTFSIRHGSSKYLGHDHLIHELGVNAHDCKCLAQCTYTKKKWIEAMQKLGRI